MKTLFVISTLMLSLMISGCGTDDKSPESVAQAEEYYTCPMHPSVRSDRPGACPVCGMALVKKTAITEATDSSLTSLAGISLSPTQRVLANITSVPVAKQRLLKQIVSVGVVEKAEPLQSTVSARFRGRIEKLFVSFTGEKVLNGQPLFELYSPDLVSAQQEYLLAIKGNTPAATGDNLFGVSASIVQSVRERLKVHFGMTEKQIQNIEQSGTVRTTLTFFAPLTGTVLRKEVIEGQYVDEGSVLYELADLSVVWMYLDVYEQDMPHVRTGLDVQLTSDAFPGRTFSGRVAFVDPVLNPETRTIRARIEARNSENLLKPGMFVRGAIEALLQPTLVVPNTAILSTGLNDVVWVEVRPNAFEPRSVIRGFKTDQGTQVLGGLREGEKIVATGGYLIDSESSLQMPKANPHAGHVMSSESKTQRANNDLFIRVQGGYSPNVIRGVKGTPLRLHFVREEDASCTEEVVFKDFNIRKTLAAFDTTTVAFVPDRRGTFHFACGMDMVHGTLVVE